METEENDCTTFSFDRVFLPDAIQPELFDYVGRPIIDDILTGYNGTVFAYGQTGSGKTYTMMGRDIYDETDRGIIPRAASLVFDAAANSETEAEFTMKCSMIEIYKETIIDLRRRNAGCYSPWRGEQNSGKHKNEPSKLTKSLSFSTRSYAEAYQRI